MVAGMELDYRSVDGLIPVLFKLEDGSTVLEIERCKRGFTSVGQANQSGGVIRAGDAVFRISKLELPDGVTPGTKCQISPSDEATDTWYTILQVLYAHPTQVFHCTARNLVAALGLRQIADLQERTLVQGDDGSAEWTWATILEDEPCRLQPLSATVKEEYGVEDLKVTHAVFLIETQDVSERNRFVIGGKYYYVKSWRDAEALGLPFVVIVEEGKADGFPMVRPESDSSGEESGGAPPVRGRRAHGEGPKANSLRTEPDGEGSIRPRRASAKGARRPSGRNRDDGG